MWRPELGDLHSDNVEAMRTIEFKARRWPAVASPVISVAKPELQPLRVVSAARSGTESTVHTLVPVPVMACTGTRLCRNPTCRSKETIKHAAHDVTGHIRLT